METRYNSQTVEGRWYKFWEDSGFFNAAPDKTKEPYCIVIPPPNVTGILHMGHALNNTIQDILIRYKRMQGYCALWIPGTDHAGIATQNVVERRLAAEGIKRDDLGRDNFIERVWKWRKEYGSTIVRQLRRLGASCDWSRERFTMDEGLSEAVLEAFIRLYQKGLIYRGKYIINWCPRCMTALSDEEVDHKEQEGFLYYLKYPAGTGGEHVTVATTRPETMLGDVAVAVHPTDQRFEFLKDNKIILPIVNRELDLVRDESVDPGFGTGAVKVTPAHDPNDFEIAARHGLKPIVIMDESGVMNENAAGYKGMDRFKARNKIIADLEAQGLVEKIEPYLNAVGRCYRCDTVIEPYISMQWFVKMKPLAKKAVSVVKKNNVEFYPVRWEKVYLHWMENIRDWCISRQIWWGHRIPVYYCRGCYKIQTSDPGQDVKKNKGIIVARKKPDLCPDCGSGDIYQDNDVLDTWFSSWLWPFSTMGWPEVARSKKLGADSKKLKTINQEPITDLDYFYPTSTLVTAQEILFFWVARMIMAGLEFIGEVPFSDVYIHGTVRDEKGRKMSKSLGNIIDPLEIIDEYGADALRFSLISITAIGQDVFLSKDKFVFGRNFTNKIWNAARFLLLSLGEPGLESKDIDYSLFDKWILAALKDLSENVRKSLDSYDFNEAASLLYEFFWHSFCDWYLELKKKDLYSESRHIKSQASSMLIFILDNTLRLLHPFMPFITEEIWQMLRPYLDQAYRALGFEYNDSDSIMLSAWPVIPKKYEDKSSKAIMNNLTRVIQAVRNIRSELNIPASKEVEVIVVSSDKRLLKILQEYFSYLAPLANICKLSVSESGIERPKHSAFGITTEANIYVLLEGVIDLDKEKERLLKKTDKLKKELDLARKKLNNKDFISKADDNVVAKVKESEAVLNSKISDILAIIESI